jgi:fatty acid desaturase
LKSIINQHIITLQHPGALKAGVQMNNPFILQRRKYAVASRLIYVYVNIVCPIQNAAAVGKIGNTIVHILSMGFIASLLMATVIALSHNNELVTRDPLQSMRKTGKPICWFQSQVETSTTYGGFIAGCLTGGLNFQIEHHLFPRMCSAHYPYIAPAVRAVCKKHGVQYGYYPWIWQNLISTMKYIHQVGTAEFWKNPMDGDF